MFSHMLNAIKNIHSNGAPTSLTSYSFRYYLFMF